MSHEVGPVVPVVYVTDVARSERFYGLLGFGALLSGTDETWQWSVLQAGERSLLLASNGTSPGPDPGPAVLYINVSDLESVSRALTGAGTVVEPLGFPDHAPGGEARVADPDGHGILLGQPTGIPREAAGDAQNRLGTLQAAAEAVQRRGGAEQLCQVGGGSGESCDRVAKVKLADSWGDTVWSCIEHADEVLINAPGTFLATEDSQGLGQYLRLRRRAR